MIAHRDDDLIDQGTAMNCIELVLAMLLAVVASSYVVRILPLPIPLPLVQIAMGAGIAGVLDHGVVLDPQIFFLLFLPPLLFLDAGAFQRTGYCATRR